MHMTDNNTGCNRLAQCSRGVLYICKLWRWCPCSLKKYDMLKISKNPYKATRSSTGQDKTDEATDKQVSLGFEKYCSIGYVFTFKDKPFPNAGILYAVNSCGPGYDHKHYDVITRIHFPHDWPLVRGIHQWIPLTKRYITVNFDIFLVTYFNQLLNKQPSCRWSQNLYILGRSLFGFDHNFPHPMLATFEWKQQGTSPEKLC